MKVIDEGKRQYKVELHSHTSCSDGAYSPKELKALYQQNGFDAVAFTDHDIFLRHNELTDENFVALNGYELNVCTAENLALRCIHLNFIAEDPEIKVMPGYDPQYVFQSNAKRYIGRIQGTEFSGFRDPSPEGMNRIIKAGNDNGFLVSFNHPAWSLCTDRDYLPLEGLFAIEVHNSGDAVYGRGDENDYRHMLLRGKQLKCLATNDFHSLKEHGLSLLGAVYVQAEALTYGALIEALKRGRFYSSNGPRITRLEIEGDVLHIACSSAQSIVVDTGSSEPKHSYSVDGTLTGGSFKLGMAEKEWFRVIVTDKEGRKAWSNAVFNYPLRQLEAQYPDGCERLLICGREETLKAADAAAQGKTCFITEFVSQQIDELIRVGTQMKSRKITAAFSVTDSRHFDLYYYAGQQEQQRQQAMQLKALEDALPRLEKWLREENISLRLFALRPLDHNPQIYDYRNSYIREINQRLQKFCNNNHIPFIDAYGAMAEENGILSPNLEDSETRRDCYRALLQY